MQRRKFLRWQLGLMAAWLMRPLDLLADWNQPAFEASKPEEAAAALHIEHAEKSDKISIVAPDFAENGAIVQIEVHSQLENTESMAIFAEKNPTPLIAVFQFHAGIQPSMITRIKMAESANLKVVVKAAGQYWMNERFVEVAIGGCG
jgi:sulfur-oxidizing protein SoxY